MIEVDSPWLGLRQGGFASPLTHRLLLIWVVHGRALSTGVCSQVPLYSDGSPFTSRLPVDKLSVTTGFRERFIDCSA